MRSALLDVADAHGQSVPDGRFDEHDLAAFTDAFDTAAGALDYGRFDLNDDGHSGGAGLGRFDLTADRPARWATAQQTILTLPLDFDETQLTDQQILCFYANSSRFAGDPTVRDEFDAQRCMPPVDLQVDLDQSVSPGVDTPLTIHVLRTDITDGSGAPLAQQGVRLELSVVGGTVGAVTGLTDATGEFATTARLVSPATTVTVDIVARAGQNGPVLATKRVSASTNAGPHVELLSRAVAANASGTATVGQEDGGQQTVNDTHSQVAPPDTFGAFSGSASAAGTASNKSGDKASFSGSGSVDQSITTSSGTPLSVQSNGSCNASANVIQVTFPNEVSTSVQSGGSLLLRFKVVGGPLQYALSSSGSGAELRDLSDFSDVASGSGSGTLDPGSYDVSGAAICASAGGGGESESYSLNLTLTP